jgi:hypothetical protein
MAGMDGFVKETKLLSLKRGKFVKVERAKNGTK